MTRSSVATLFALAAAFAAAAPLTGCAAEPSEEDAAPAESSGDALTAKADEHWIYDGALPVLEGATITVSLKGHTARVSGYLPARATIPQLPHVRLTPEGARTKIDIV